MFIQKRKDLVQDMILGMSKIIDSLYAETRGYGKIVMKLTDEEKKVLAREKRLYATYGITTEEYEALLISQKGVCEICKTLPPSGRLCVDHIHIKGFKKMTPVERKKYVRGLLCFLCNTGLKGFEKTSDPVINRQRLNGTYLYFQRHKLKGETS